MAKDIYIYTYMYIYIYVPLTPLGSTGPHELSSFSYGERYLLKQSYPAIEIIASVVPSEIAVV